jgi:hypothetical protein
MNVCLLPSPLPSPHLSPPLSSFSPPLSPLLPSSPPHLLPYPHLSPPLPLHQVSNIPSPSKKRKRKKRIGSGNFEPAQKRMKGDPVIQNKGVIAVLAARKKERKKRKDEKKQKEKGESERVVGEGTAREGQGEEARKRRIKEAKTEHGKRIKESQKKRKEEEENISEDDEKSSEDEEPWLENLAVEYAEQLPEEEESGEVGKEEREEMEVVEKKVAGKKKRKGKKGQKERVEKKVEEEKEKKNVDKLGMLQIPAGVQQKSNLEKFFEKAVEGGDVNVVGNVDGKKVDGDVLVVLDGKKLDGEDQLSKGRKANRIKSDFYQTEIILGGEGEKDSIYYCCNEEGCGGIVKNGRLPALHGHLITDHRDLYMERVMGHPELYLAQLLAREVRNKIKKEILDKMSVEDVEEKIGWKWDWADLEARKQKESMKIVSAPILEKRMKKMNEVVIEKMLKGGEEGGEETGQRELMAAKVELESLPSMGMVPDEIFDILDHLLRVSCSPTTAGDWEFLDGGRILKDVKGIDDGDSEKLQKFMQGVVCFFPFFFLFFHFSLPLSVQEESSFLQRRHSMF